MYVYKEGMSLEESKNLAYWERNMLALLCADAMRHSPYFDQCGWYYDTDNNWDGWHRVISLDDGHYTFHIPDDFDVGSLPEIEPNWDGHTTEQKWRDVMEIWGIEEGSDS